MDTKLELARLVEQNCDSIRTLEADQRDLVAALRKVREDINWMLNNRKFLNPDVFDYIDKVLETVDR